MMWSACIVHIKPLFVHPDRFLTISLAHHVGVPKPVILSSGRTHTGPCEAVKFRSSSKFLLFTDFQQSVTEENGMF
jgi:hypothetical protein